MNVVVDFGWFLVHIYRPTLDRSNHSKAFSGVERRNEVEINRRTYKKMLKYFETKND